MKYLENAPLYQISKSDKYYQESGISFCGTPHKHPYDEEKMLLVEQPFSKDTLFYEFKIEDILHAQDMPSRVTRKGESVPLVKIWIRKGSLGIKYEPFKVGEPETA